MQILVFDDEILTRLAEVRAHAERHVFTADDQAAIITQQQQPVGSLDAYICRIPVGVEMVLTVEEHPGAWMRHLSVSVLGEYPDQNLIITLMPQVGFTRALADCDVNYYVHPTGNLHILSVMESMADFQYEPPA